MNVYFIDSVPPDEQFLHITSSNNDSLKYFCDMIFLKTLYFANILHFGWSVWLGALEVFNTSREIFSLSEANSTGVFNLEHIWHILLSIYTMLNFFNVCIHNAYDSN